MNEMKLFENPEFGAIRTVEVGGEPWLVGKDVAQALGYSNPRDALDRHVDDEDKAAVGIHDGSQSRNMTIINESGLYALVLSSKLPGRRSSAGGSRRRCCQASADMAYTRLTS